METGAFAEPTFSELDRRFMREALALARQGLGYVEPNPLVGCLLTADQQIIGSGWHAKFGGEHAERAALNSAIQAGHAARLSGATAYVTLEPCCHFGKTPPCTEALLRAGVGRVVVAMLDPFEQVSGAGVRQLIEAGVEVQVGLEEEAARELNAPYLKRLHTGRPWILAKWAMSLDGKIATRTGHSQWISCPESRAAVQDLRARVDAILIGSATALADDPRLTARTEQAPPRIALRVVTDTRLQVPVTSQLVHSARQTPTLLWAGPQAESNRAKALIEAGCLVEVCPAEDPLQRLDLLLQHLVKQHQATQVLVEGGGKLLGSLLQLRQIDECEIFLAPKLLGGAAAPSPIAGLGFGKLEDGPACRIIHCTPSGNDLRLHCRLDWSAA